MKSEGDDVVLLLCCRKAGGVVLHTRSCYQIRLLEVNRAFGIGRSRLSQHLQALPVALPACTPAIRGSGLCSERYRPLHYAVAQYRDTSLSS